MPGKRPPTLRSQWLGQLLKEARTEAELTLQDAASYLSTDKGTMSRYESGHIPAKPQDVVALLNLYGVDDLARRDALIELSREAWRRDWWDGYHGQLVQKSIDYAWLEDRAITIRSFDSLTLPGLVQTPEFAEAVIRAHEPDKHDEYIQRGVEFRMERQRVLRKRHPPTVTSIIDEALLHRPIGGAETMAAQCERLLGLAEAGTVEIRVLPFAVGAHGGQQGAFQIFELPDPFPQVGYAETISGATYIESEGAVIEFVRAYDRLRKAALPADKSAALIAKAAKGWT